jgi:uncharacterized membrane protein
MKESTSFPTPHPYTLRDLPLAARLTLALFLLSVGLGYVAALVQLHFQHASPGAILPSGEDAVRIFHGEVGDKPRSKLEQLLPEDFKDKKMNGQGQMTSAFYKRAEDYDETISEKASELAKKRGQKKATKEIKEEAKTEVDKERDGERLVMIAWVRGGAKEEEYSEDKYLLPNDLAKHPFTRKYLVAEGDKPADPPAVKIHTLFQERCATCHAEGGEAQNFPLTTYPEIKKYTVVKTSSGMSLEKLAQTTHVHLLGFSMLYSLTGLILAFTSYPRFLRVLLCPLPLLAQVADIGFWWLARLEPPHGPSFAQAITVSGGLVAVGLLLHIVLSLFNMFRWQGWLVLILLFAGAGFGGYVAKSKVIDPFLARENAPDTAVK